MFRFRSASFILALIVLMTCSSAEEHEAIDEQRASQDAPERMPGTDPDSLAEIMEPLDTLFLDYDAALFQPVHVDEAAIRRIVDAAFDSMTLDQKIGQLFIVNYPTTGVTGTALNRAADLVKKYAVGGFLISRLADPRSVYDLVEHLQGISAVPLFFAADYERGVGRFNNALTELPSNMALGATRDSTFAAAAGRLTALESRATGINLLFAPVVDVNNNPDNPIINIRSYSEDPDLVGTMAAAYVREAEKHGVLTTLKHFPGHGNTSVDSHTHMGTVEGTRETLEKVELRPYEIVLNQTKNLAGIMSAHLWVRALDPEPLPATFSSRVLRDLLRDSLGFTGLVITDDVKMGALQNRFDYRERTIRPLLAGADVVLTPDDVGKSVAAVRSAIQSGRLSQEEIDRSVRRILEAKARAGLFHHPGGSKKALAYLLEKPRGASLARTIADRAVTLLKTDDTLPLQSGSRIALVQISNYTNSPSISAAMEHFAGTLATDGYHLHERLDRDPPGAEISRIIQKAESADVIVLSLYLRLQSGRGKAGLRSGQEKLVRNLLNTGKPVVLVTFGNPYAVTTFSESDAFVVAYDQTLESTETAARILRGEQNPTGKLPITVKPYPFGSGLDSIR